MSSFEPKSADQSLNEHQILVDESLQSRASYIRSHLLNSSNVIIGSLGSNSVASNQSAHVAFNTAQPQFNNR